VPAFLRGGFRHVTRLAVLATLMLSLWGCTTLDEYVHNGFKVGPNYHKAPAPVAEDWIDASDKRVRREEDDLSQWWKVFNDPILDRLICTAYQQNLTLRQAGFRVLEARAQLGISVGNIMPQAQTMNASYERIAESGQTSGRTLGSVKRFFAQWNYGFNLAWELDFWGRFRRAIEADSDSLNASVEGYDDVLVTLLSDVATAYVNMRTLEKRIYYARENARIQNETYKNIKDKGRLVAGLDVDQALSNVKQTESTIPELEIALRQQTDQLCILLGIPPEELRTRLAMSTVRDFVGKIPTTPPDVIVGIPADLLRRRPDVRQAERLAAAQCAQIGVADSLFYPHVSIVGTIQWQAEHFSHLFLGDALSGSFAPGFQWDILNYGRILNNERLQDAKFQELIAVYQQTVLNANREAEDGLVQFLKAQERTKLLKESTDANTEVVKALKAAQDTGVIDFTRVAQVQLNQVFLQDNLAQAEGEIALGLIQVYKALGGGWQVRLNGCNEAPITPQAPAAAPPMLPAIDEARTRPLETRSAPVSQVSGGQK
jgi:NodT family efflux transporter outer membrane factor (OMF) lipoprotein